MFIKHFIRRGLCVLLCLLALAPLRMQAQSKEYQIKAAFLFNFAQFTEWPPATFISPAAPFRIGILGDDPFGTALEQTVQGEAINNHKIVIQRAQRVGDLKDCQIIFISKSEKGKIGEILSGLDSGAVLTVSELDGFTQGGGGINFYLEGKKVRFEINPAAAQRGGLKVSSQLLSLGKVISSGKEDK